MEKRVRFVADTYPNSYNLCIFACCREMQKKTYQFMSVAGVARSQDELDEQQAEHFEASRIV